jgi:hypothetical protein
VLDTPGHTLTTHTQTHTLHRTRVPFHRELSEEEEEKDQKREEQEQEQRQKQKQKQKQDPQALMAKRLQR